MEFLNSIINWIYYGIVGFTAMIMIYNLVKEKSWEKEVLYILVIIPFLLRLLGLK